MPFNCLVSIGVSLGGWGGRGHVRLNRGWPFLQLLLFVWQAILEVKHPVVFVALALLLARQHRVAMDCGHGHPSIRPVAGHSQRVVLRCSEIGPDVILGAVWPVVTVLESAAPEVVCAARDVATGRSDTQATDSPVPDVADSIVHPEPIVRPPCPQRTDSDLALAHSLSPSDRTCVLKFILIAILLLFIFKITLFFRAFFQFY